MIGRTWQLQDAKNKLSDVVSAALRQGPQVITRRGIQTAVVISYEEYTRLQKPDKNIVEFFANSPLAGVDLDLERDRSLPRDTSL